MIYHIRNLGVTMFMLYWSQLDSSFIYVRKEVGRTIAKEVLGKSYNEERARAYYWTKVDQVLDILNETRESLTY